MEDDSFEIFLHREGKPAEVLAGKADETLLVVLERANIAVGDGEWLVFVGESEEVLARAPDDDSDDGEDQHEPVDVRLVLAELKLEERRHVHVTRCKRIAVEVNFAGKHAKHKFSPTTTVGVVTEWARRRKKFNIDPASASEFVLQICNSTVRPRSDEHLGELTDGKTCALCFDLVKEQTPQG